MNYSTGYEDDDPFGPLCIKLPQIIGYVKCFYSNKIMYFKVIDDKLFKKYTKIWARVSSLMNIELDSEPVYGDNDKYVNTKIKSYGDKINTNFQCKQIPKENASYKCLPLIILDSVVRVNKKYYLQTLFEKCKYTIKMNKKENLINDELSPSLSDESDNEPDSESDSDSDSDESDSESNIESDSEPNNESNNVSDD